MPTCIVCAQAKVVRVSDDRKFIWLSSDVILEEVIQCKLQVVCQEDGTVEVATYGDGSEDELYLGYCANDPRALNLGFYRTAESQRID